MQGIYSCGRMRNANWRQKQEQPDSIINYKVILESQKNAKYITYKCSKAPTKTMDIFFNPQKLNGGTFF